MVRFAHARIVGDDHARAIPPKPPDRAIDRRNLVGDTRRQSIRRKGAREMAQYVVHWVEKAGGSAADNEAAAKRAMQLFSKWTPHASADFKAMVATLYGRGGYAFIETDDVAALAEGPLKFATMFDFTIVPVVDMVEAVGMMTEAIEYRDSIS